jgi:putative inorganic carbon (hco3(-)) transporter
MLPIGLLLFLALISMFNAKDRLFSLFEWLELFKMALVSWIVADAIVVFKDWRWILFVLVVCLGLESLIALAQTATGSSLGLEMLGARTQAGVANLGSGNMSRVGGTIGGPNALALYLDFLLPIPLALALSKPIKRYWLWVIFMLGSVALFVTLSRAGWLGMVIGGGIILWDRIRRFSTVTRFYMIAIASLFLVLLIGILFVFDNPIKSRFTANDDGSAYIRIPLMKVAVNMIKSNPWSGIGLNNYTEVDQFYDTTPERVTTVFPWPVHCTYLQLAAELGVFALFVFFWIIGLVFRKGFYLLKKCQDDQRDWVLGILAGMTGFLIHGLVENATLASNLMPFWFFCGILAGLSKMHEKAVA